MLLNIAGNIMSNLNQQSIFGTMGFPLIASLITKVLY